MKVAVLDDTNTDAELLVSYIEKFQRENETQLQVDVYHASFDFLEEYNNQYDVIFLDIEMPGSDGLEVAKEIRTKDNAVGIIFVTNMAQYAIHGYEVDAIDFIVKPVSYYLFLEKMEKAMRFCESRKARQIVLNCKNGIYRLMVSDILYIEKEKDYLVYHTKASYFREYGTIKEVKEKLNLAPFAECTHGCLVNLEQVNFIGKDMVLVAKEKLPLSRRMKKEFTQKYVDFIGGV